MSVKQQYILIVDDDDAVRISLESHFEDCGFKIMSAENAEVAIKNSLKQTPDAAVIDLQMPGMSGTELIRELYKQCPDTVYVIYTGSYGFKIPNDITNLDVVSENIFTKPVKILDDISDEISRLLKSVSK